ncbi:MAG: CapA family protein [Bacteroidales bacterium]|nr:CapA family protein [Bacteroidales bacterium]
MIIKLTTKHYKIHIILIINLLLISCYNDSVKIPVKVQNTLIEKNINKSDNSEISLLFIGDIMEHQSQIDNSLNTNTMQYDFSDQFEYITPIIEQCDATIANLEVTLSGPPFTGYPEFSSPDQLLDAIKNAGINYLVTANNHIYDYGQAGFTRTLNTIDNQGFVRTGVFLNNDDKEKNHPMVIEKNGFRIALFNYTYGINGDFYNEPNIINIIDYAEIQKDIDNAKTQNFDAIIFFMHWGKEYERLPNQEQIDLANFCFKNGVDIIIGSHPHVLQPMKKFKNNRKDAFIAYSLGNYVSNYGTWRYADGGAIVKINLKKDRRGNLQIDQAGYYLIWVYRPVVGGRTKYKVVPVSKFEKNGLISDNFKHYFDIFKNDSRQHLEQNNINVEEIILY